MKISTLAIVYFLFVLLNFSNEKAMAQSGACSNPILLSQNDSVLNASGIVFYSFVKTNSSDYSYFLPIDSSTFNIDSVEIYSGSDCNSLTKTSTSHNPHLGFLFLDFSTYAVGDTIRLKSFFIPQAQIAI